jgi:CheY-like chemotaxis protein
VQVASSGAAALEMMNTFRPQVVFSDISMPEMNGYELARRLRERPEGAEMMLAAMTGYAKSEDRERALAAGFDHYLIKPAEIEVLQALFAAVRR